MSGTLNNIYNNVNFALNLHYEAMAALQEQAYTGSRINRASDDPSTAYQVLGLNSQNKSLGNYVDTISDTISILEISSVGIDNMAETFLKARASLAGVTDTDKGAGQTVYPKAIDNYLENVFLYANWDYSGQHLYGGSDTTSAPYIAIRDSSGKITSVTYQGSLEDRNVQVASSVESSAFYIGDNIFRSHDRDDPKFILKNTGAVAGTGTASVTGYTWLTVSEAVNEKQTITVTGATSGDINIAFGGDNVEVDFNANAATVQAALITLSSIDSGNVTCTGTSLNDVDGITIEFTGGALALTNVAEMVVSNSIIDPLDAGAPEISTDTDGGKQLSIDGGTAVGIPIGDKTNVAVKNPGGKVLYVNATNITSTGVELVSAPGTHDIFNTLITARDILELTSKDGYTHAQLTTLKDNAITAVNEMHSLLLQDSVAIGSKIGFLSDLKDSLNNIKYDVEDDMTRLQEADIAQVAIDLSRREVLYQMSLAVAGRLMSISLLDFIR